MTVRRRMEEIHLALMKAGFPYHSVSVTYRPQDLGLHIFMDESVKEMFKGNERLMIQAKAYGFSWSFVK